jgi:release factor glutamine methyltransferase
MTEMSTTRHPDLRHGVDQPAGTYSLSFGPGYDFDLLDRADTFRVSPAGIALGNHLIRHVTSAELSGRILEIGTGSGAIALLLRTLGATRITATDISAAAVATAQLNEANHFDERAIDFQCVDLFPDGREADRRFDLIVFNPPGWRAPSEFVEAELSTRHHSLDLRAMFYGDTVLARFLQQLPEHLTDSGRAIVGFNSLVGVADITSRTALHARLRECIEFPLLFYTDEWRAVRSSLLSQFEQGRIDYGANFVRRGDTIHWYYEITEVTTRPASVHAASAEDRCA